MDKKIGTIIVLVILLVLALGYILGNRWIDNHDAEVVLRAQAIVYNQFYATAAMCQQIPLTMNNQTINLVAIECLNR